ncbi:MAG: hypothetical protein ACLPWG_22925 [Steroidobacteraceae bacterium]
MQDLLHQIDSDYYRSARLLIVRAELDQLRRRKTHPSTVIPGKKAPGNQNARRVKS